ncbi:MAG: hypothetical protein CEE41_02760 [Hadesarchaea archaeon B3_Hades]|nr:MAG: hypothetical protein CEE41_02760 [Hadesarchaea archaeon B3_Hades]
MSEAEPRVSEMPRLYNVFDMPKLTSVRSTTTLRSKVNLKKILEGIPRTRKVKTSNKEIVKFELSRGTYLLLFPSHYIEVHAPDEGSVREVLLAFRDELFKSGLIK